MRNKEDQKLGHAKIWRSWRQDDLGIVKINQPMRAQGEVFTLDYKNLDKLREYADAITSTHAGDR